MPAAAASSVSTWQNTALFYQSLHRILGTGIDLGQAIRMAAGRIPGYAQAAAGWKARLEAGEQFHQCLRESGERSLIIALVQAGEASGHLSELCADIANFYEHCLQMKRLAIGRLIYPVILIHAALVIPAIVPVIASGAPVWTMLIGPAILWSVVAVVVLALRHARLAALRSRLTRKVPVLHGISHDLVTANCALVLGAGLKAGMLYDQALELAANSCGHASYGEDLLRSSANLRQDPDQGLAGALAAAGLHGHAIEMIHQGEVSGSLERSLQQVRTLALESFQQRLQWTLRISCGIIIGAVMLMAAIMIIGMYMQVVIGPLREMSEW